MGSLHLVCSTLTNFKINLKKIGSPTLWLAIALGLLIGILFILQPPINIPPSFESYDSVARHLVRGEGFSFTSEGRTLPYLFRTPGYPLFLAAIYSVFGSDPIAVYCFQVGLHLLTILLLYSLTRNFFGKHVAGLTAILTALFPLTTIYISTVLPEVFSTFLLALSLWVFARALRRNSLWLMFLAGIVISYSTLVRPAFALFSLFLFATVWVMKGNRKTFLLPFLSLHVGFLLVWLPWVVRNYQVSGEFIPLSTEAPYQWWVGSLSVGKHLTRHWENPEYYFQRILVNNRLQHINNPSLQPMLIELEVRKPHRISPIKLHYRTMDKGPVVTKRMRSIRTGFFHAEISPQPIGTKINYWVSYRSPIGGATRYTYPNKIVDNTDGFTVRVVPDLLTDFNMPGVFDIFDVVRVGRLFVQQNSGLLKPGVILNAQTPSYFYTELDFLFRKLSGSTTLSGIELINPQMLRFHRSSGADLKLQLKSIPLTLRRLVQNNQNDEEYRFAARAIPIAQGGAGAAGGRWYNVESCGFYNRLRGYEPNSESKPCIKSIGPSAIQQTSKENKAYMKLAWINLKREPWLFGKAILARIPRLWMVIGRTGTGQTGRTGTGQAYQVPGSTIIYPLLTFGTALNLLLGVAGFVLTRKKWRQHLILILPIIYLTLVHTVFHTEGRYTAPGRPYLLIYTSITLIALWSKIRSFGPSRRTG